jgi:integrase
VTQRRRAHVGRTLVIDRRIRGIGRIRMASGLQSKAQFNLLNDHITDAAGTVEGLAILEAMHRGAVRPAVFFRHAKSGTLHLIPLGTAAGALVEAVTAWREDTRRDVAVDTYRVRGELIAHLTAVAKPGAMVADLPDTLRVLRTRMKGARDFNIQRSYAQAFLRDTLGKLSPVYLALQAVPVRKVRPTVRKHPLTPVELLTIAGAFATVRARRIAASTAKRGVRPIEAKGDDAIVMALTGMNPKEYAGRWTVEPDRVRLFGTKRGGRVRDIPKAFPCALWPHDGLAAPSVGTKNFWRWFREAAKEAGIACTPYDLRRSFATWLEAAGIIRARRRLYLGHAAGDITDLYEQHEVTAFLEADGAKLRAWLDAQCSPTLPTT